MRHPTTRCPDCARVPFSCCAQPRSQSTTRSPHRLNKVSPLPPAYLRCQPQPTPVTSALKASTPSPVIQCLSPIPISRLSSVCPATALKHREPPPHAPLPRSCAAAGQLHRGHLFFLLQHEPTPSNPREESRRCAPLLLRPPPQQQPAPATEPRHRHLLGHRPSATPLTGLTVGRHDEPLR